MPSEMDFPARGKVTAVNENGVVFVPANSTYELHLVAAGGRYDGPVNEPVEVFIRGKARKVYTVGTGGTFITPIFGPPKIVQGRVRYGTPDTLVLHATVPVIIDLPADDDAIDLDEGAIAGGKMVNAVLLPGATLELATKVAVR